MVRMVSLSDGAYSALAERKHGGESFSKVVLKLCEKEGKGSLLDFAGAWGAEGGEKETQRIIDEIYARRRIRSRRKLGW